MPAFRAKSAALLLVLLTAASGLTVVQHHFSQIFRLQHLSYTAGVYHIHSPSHFIEAHGFAMPGFRIVETRPPEAKKALDSDAPVLSIEFLYTSLFDHPKGRRLRGKIFTHRLNTSHVLLKDSDGQPKVFGTLSLRKSANGTDTFLHAHGNILRGPPRSSLLEDMLLCRGVAARDVERAIQRGYRDLNADANLKLYLNMVLERESAL
jgi:hypothetical protein